MPEVCIIGCILNVRKNDPFWPFLHSSAIVSPGNLLLKVTFHTHMYLVAWSLDPFVIPMLFYIFAICF